MHQSVNDRTVGSLIGAFPDARGHFGPYGGRFVAETLMQPLEELRLAWERYREDPDFLAELDADLRDFVGRPSPLYLASRWSDRLGGARIYLKREDLNHTGAHKVNNTVGQAMLARRMGKRRVIAETGAGQHGVATATVAARYGMPCVVYMGAEDIQRQTVNVYRMKLLGAEVVPVTSGSRTLKDALNEAMRDWVTNVDDTFYIIGTAEVARVLRPGGGLYLVDFGHLKSEKSIEYFAYQYSDRQPELFTLDYLYSLRAAFPLADFQRLTDRHLAGRARVYSTFLMPFMVVVKSPPRAGEVPQGVRAGLAALRAALPSYHRTDLQDLRTFFRLGGLASPLLG